MSKNFTDGEILLASDVNAYLNHSLIRWTPWTPTWTAGTTAPTLGDGLLDGSFVQIGKTVHANLRLIWGSTTTVGVGAWGFSLPVNSRGTQSSGVLGVGNWQATSPIQRRPQFVYQSGPNLIRSINVDGSYIGSTWAGVPAPEDRLLLGFTYEAA